LNKTGRSKHFLTPRRKGAKFSPKIQAAINISVWPFCAQRFNLIISMKICENPWPKTKPFSALLRKPVQATRFDMAVLMRGKGTHC